MNRIFPCVVFVVPVSESLGRGAKTQIPAYALRPTESKSLEEQNRTQHLEEAPGTFTVSNGVGPGGSVSQRGRQPAVLSDLLNVQEMLNLLT